MVTEELNKARKVDEDIKSMCRDIINQASSLFRQEQERDKLCWDVYAGKFDNSKFKYLTQVEGFSYPAKFRNIGSEIVRSKVNLLESKQARRTFRFRAVGIDERTLKQKYQNKIKAYLDALNSFYDDQADLIQTQMQMIQDKMRDMEQQLQVQPENEEMAMQLQQLQQNLPMIRLEFNKIIRALSREKVSTDDLRDKINYFLKHSETEIIEQVANAALKSAIQTEDLKDHWNVGMREKIVTGRPTYLVYYDNRREDVVFKQAPAGRAYYNKGGNNKWSTNGEWCAYEEYMAKSQIESEFELTEAESNMLHYYHTGNYAELVNYVGNSAYFDPSDNLKTTHDSISVWRVWFLVPREITYSETPNKYRPEESFYNLVDPKKKPKKDERRHTALIYDQYYCVVIGNIICINFGSQNAMYRPKDTPGLPQLPLVARTYNSITEHAYSPIYRVRELIELYEIVNYKKELAIALAGVKGMVMDKSQKPDDMSTNKWTYYRKMGTMWIETVKKGRKTPPSFNQFQTYDDSLSDSIMYIDQVLAGIEALMGKIMGITPPAEGQFVSKDPVANVKMSNEQSSLITEILFEENDAVFSKALELYLNLKIQYVWDKGKVMNYLNEDLEEILVQIPSSLLGKSDFRLYAHNNIKEDERLEDLRQIAIGAWNKSEIPSYALATINKIDDINEMEKQLIKLSQEAEMIRQQNNEATAQSAEQAKQQTMQLQAEIDMQAENMIQQMKAAELELKRAELEFEANKFSWEAQFKEKELEIKKNLETMKIGSENQIESAYLQEEGRNNRVQEMLKSFELKINAILQEMSIREGEKQSIRKTSVDIEKNMRNKNNIKD